MEHTTLRDLATETVEAFNRADWTAVRDLSDPGLVYEEPGTGRRADGVEAVLAALQAWREAVPNATGEIVRVVVDGDTAVLEIVWRGTHDGPMDTPTGVLPATGRSFEIWGSLWQRWSDGRLVHERHHLDILALLAQIGALPAPASA